MPRPVQPVSPIAGPADGDEDHRARLTSLRDRLLAAMDAVEPKDLSPLALRYQRVLTELAELPERKAGDDVDELAARRTARRAADA